MPGDQEVVAQTLALKAIGFVAQQEDILSQFLTQTGLSLVDLKESIETPETFAAVLDWLLQDDRGLLAFCEEFNVTPDIVWRARNQLPGAPVHYYQSC